MLVWLLQMMLTLHCFSCLGKLASGCHLSALQSANRMLSYCCRLREAAEAEALAKRLAEEEAERLRKEEEARQREAARLEALRLEQEARLKVRA